MVYVNILRMIFYKSKDFSTSLINRHSCCLLSFCVRSVLLPCFWLSVPVQSIAWKWPVTCPVER